MSATPQPHVPGAILFDLLNGGDKTWGRFPPYRDLGYAAAAAAGSDFALGSAGAGMGATTATLKGGLGSASAKISTGAMVAALVAVNAVGSVTVGNGPWFWAAPYEQDGEFGGLGCEERTPFGGISVWRGDRQHPWERPRSNGFCDAPRLVDSQLDGVGLVGHWTAFTSSVFSAPREASSALVWAPQ